MMTVGYGDIRPVSELEILYVIIMTLLSTVSFAYTVNTIGTIFTEIA